MPHFSVIVTIELERVLARSQEHARARAHDIVTRQGFTVTNTEARCGGQRKLVFNPGVADDAEGVLGAGDAGAGAPGSPSDHGREQ